jgi:hypothetical protein
MYDAAGDLLKIAGIAIHKNYLKKDLAVTCQMYLKREGIVCLKKGSKYLTLF